MLARCLRTLSYVLLAIFALVSRKTVTSVIIDPIIAGSIIGAPAQSTLINVDFTMGTFKSGVSAVAAIFIDTVVTLASMHAWVTFTVVDVGTTYTVSKSRLTNTSEFVDFINASGVILARISGTFINVRLTIDTYECNTKNKISSIETITPQCAG